MDKSRIVTGAHITEKRERAREFRREPTPAEHALWQAVRGSKLGVQFRRQQIVDGLIADFYCHAAGLIVEVDGEVHQFQRDADAERDEIHRGRGLRVLRLTNDEVLRDLPGCLARIRAAIGKESS